MRILRSLVAVAILLTSEGFAQDPLPPEWRKPRDTQDRAALDKIAADAEANASRRANDSKALYNAALAESLRAEVLMEQKDKHGSGDAAVAGIKTLDRALSMSPNSAEYHRLMGALCGQTVPANIMFAMKYGKCAMDEVNKALELDAKSPLAWLSKGVGNYYLPASFGGGPDLALKDLEKSAQLDPNNADTWLWQGIVLRKLNRNAEARKAFEKSLALDPARVWTKQQLDKTPEK